MISHESKQCRLLHCHVCADGTVGTRVLPPATHVHVNTVVRGELHSYSVRTNQKAKGKEDLTTISKAQVLVLTTYFQPVHDLGVQTHVCIRFS